MPDWFQNRRWYLGIDIGAVGLAATLFDSQTARSYPVGWVAKQEGNSATFLRLPAVAYVSVEQLDKMPESPLAVGDRAIKIATSQPDASAGILLSNLRQFLSIALPYRSAHSHTWEPRLQWSESLSVSLAWVQQAMVTLLETLRHTEPTDPLACTSRELEAGLFQTALAELAGVVLGCPQGWSDTFCFNLREAVLAVGLVSHPDQVFFIQDAIAVLLSALPLTALPGNSTESTPPPPISPNPSLPTPSLPTPSPLSTEPQPLSWTGGTLVVSAGATMTELLLVDLPANLHNLTREDFACRSIAYAGNAIDQDIICQLLYPSVWGWRNLGAPSLDLPLAGEPDLPTRYRLQQRLRNNVLGQTLLKIARQAKLLLHQQNTYCFSFNDQTWNMNQQDFYNRVLAPYIQMLDRELNALLSVTGMNGQRVRQVICSGGTASFPAIANWLKQKLPNATLLPGSDTSAPFMGHLANGLARLPLFPQVLDSTRHQFGDYLLLLALLHLFPNHPLSLDQIMQQLDDMGINALSCSASVLQLLEGQLPVGLTPSRNDFVLLSSASRQNPDYSAISAAPLFVSQGNQVYTINPELRDTLLGYLATILDGKHQTLREPLIAAIETATIETATIETATIGAQTRM